MGYNDFVFIKEKGAYIKVYVRDIIYMKADKDYVEIYKVNRRYVIHSTLTDVLKKIPLGLITQINRSYAVQFNLIDRIEHYIVYINGISIPVGDTYKDSVKIQMNIL